MIIPIGTEIRTRKPPIGNYVLLALNVLIFLFTDVIGGGFGYQLKILGTLYAAVPDFSQYFTYQFLHGDVLHLAGNMLFLWIFGNPVCDRMGSVVYVLFYLAGGIFAGVVFAELNDNALLGASGSIAAVTTAFLVLFPRVRITLLLWMIVITAFQVHALAVIVFKIILWDNIIAPSLDRSAVSNVAYSAHLAGYSFGFLVTLAMLLLRGLPRNQFDLLALISRWQRRTGLTTGGGMPRARPVVVEEMDSRPIHPLTLTPAERLREEIVEAVAQRDFAEAAAGYLRLRALDEEQVLPRQAQLEVANYLAQTQRQQEAATAYEAFLQAYPTAADAPQVRLLLGLIYGRYLAALDKARQHLEAARAELSLSDQRRLAEEELRQVEARLAAQQPRP